MSLSRRRFLETGVGLLAGAQALASAGWGAVPRALAPKFRRPEIVRYDASAFTLRGVDTFIYSLEFQYPRVMPREWPDRFAKIRRAGFNAIDSYIFWNYHEREPGHFDFSELESFLQLAKNSGLFVIVRPGPYVDAEFERGAFPAYVIAKRFPVRSMHPESLRTSQHWYDHVVPVIRRHQITQGGPIILMQIENEMDFTDVPEREQREYLRFLAKLAWQGGIEVPLISNVSSVVRDRTDPDMADILDLCDFYPRWSFLTDNPLPTDTAGMTMEQKVGLSDRAVLASIRKMRSDEPDAPLAVAELGTGYYSKVGGKLAEDEEGADASELDALIKTIISQGVTYLNLYLGVGGTNFDWAAKGVTTTYDFAAPIREGGGLSDKYYEAKVLGGAIRMFGPVLARSRAATSQASSSHPDMTVYRRDNGRAGFLFVRGNTDAQHHYRLTFDDPVTGRVLTVPRKGQLNLGPRAMKMLPLNAALAGTTLRYCTAEVLAAGVNGKRSLLVLYDQPGALVEFSLPSPRECRVHGVVEYQEWSEVDQAVVLGARVGRRPEAITINDQVVVLLVPHDIALRSWFDPVSLPGLPDAADVPWLTDAYLVYASGADSARVWADIDYGPGRHGLAVALPFEPSSVRADGKDLPVEYDPMTGVARFEIVTETCPIDAVVIDSGQVWVERLDGAAGASAGSRGRTLEDMGPIPFGYVKYRAHVTFKGEAALFLRSFTRNDKKVFVNGRFVAAASTAEAFIAFPPPSWMREGDNVIEVVYELFGSTEFGETARMAELNGIDSLTVGGAAEATAVVTDWQVQTFAAPMKGRELNAQFDFKGAVPVTLSDAESSGASNAGDPVPAFAWFESRFQLGIAPRGWSAPLRLEIEASRDALIYLNARFVGRFAVSGPQSAFYLPEGLLLRGAEQNRLTIVLAYSETAAGLHSVRVSPFLEYASRRWRVEIGCPDRYPRAG
jgi:Glycosyl hydrolases family 35/Beta-galactosidase, domain 2/Beta-galactosidase jelly roll domain